MVFKMGIVIGPGPILWMDIDDDWFVWSFFKES